MTNALQGLYFDTLALDGAQSGKKKSDLSNTRLPQDRQILAR
jgi:hypothetical protein